MEITIKKYEQMLAKFKCGEITQEEWMKFCTEFLFSQPEFVEMCIRMGNEWSK